MEFICKVCNKKLATAPNLRRHISTMHLRKKDHKCKVCGLTYGLKWMLARHHRERHNPEIRRYPWKSCPATFKRTSSLREHAARAHITSAPPEVVRTQECTICSKRFHSGYDLNDHLWMHAMQPADETEDTSPEESTPLCKWLQCGESLPSEQELRTHLWAHHDEINPPNLLEPATGAPVGRHRHAPRHMLWRCELCLLSFNRQEELKEHAEADHYPEQTPPEETEETTAQPALDLSWPENLSAPPAEETETPTAIPEIWTLFTTPAAPNDKTEDPTYFGSPGYKQPFFGSTGLQQEAPFADLQPPRKVI